jgi:7,8-dihydroneopterin aldolase/epimerase/oxygenase
MDTIFIQELRIETLVGVYARERNVPQTVELNIEIGLPPHLPGFRFEEHDSIVETIDYAKVVARITEEVSQKHFKLIEALAEHISLIILEEFGAPSCKVNVTKIGVLKNVKRVGVSIARSKI